MLPLSIKVTHALCQLLATPTQSNYICFIIVTIKAYFYCCFYSKHEGDAKNVDFENCFRRKSDFVVVSAVTKRSLFLR